MTRLADVGPSENPAAIRAALTVRPWFYADLHSFGNPGYYLCFVAATSSCGNPRELGELHAVVDEIGYGWPTSSSAGPEWAELEATQRFRSQTVATTYGVMSSQSLAERIPWWGPHGDEVRMLLDQG